MMNEWWKQLYGESEGKDNKGLFPASVIFSTDLHSLGQYIQDGRRTLFETVVLIDEPKHQITLGNDPTDVDGLNYLEGRTMAFINEKAFEGTVLAHNDGGVPNVVIHASDFSEDTLGQLIYFFEKACAISGYLLGVNPFNQPAWRATRRICSPCWASPAMKRPRQSWKSAWPTELFHSLSPAPLGRKQYKK